MAKAKKTVRAMNYDKIVDGIYQGSQMTKVLPGIDAVVDLQTSIRDEPFIQGVKAFVWLPIEDQPSAMPTLTWLDAAVDLLIAWRKLNWNIFIHCTAGKSRSSLLSIAYCMKAFKISYADALAMVQAARPVVIPNSGFIKTLMAYEAQLQATDVTI